MARTPRQRAAQLKAAKVSAAKRKAGTVTERGRRANRTSSAGKTFAGQKVKVSLTNPMHPREQEERIRQSALHETHARQRARANGVTYKQYISKSYVGPR